MKFSDHFSDVASDYAAFRPDYPAALFDWLSSLCERHDLAWDCGCGSGQASLSLARHFAFVIGTDASSAQVAAAQLNETTRFSAAVSEQVPLAGHSADIVTIAQALHWFASERFFAEVGRVVRSGGIFAAWTYGMPHFASNDVQKLVHEFINGPLGPYWPPEVQMVLDGYASIDLPFEELETPDFEMEMEWTLQRFLRFVRTWSAVARYLEARGEDPVPQLADELQEACSGGEKPLTLSYRLRLRVCKV